MMDENIQTITGILCINIFIFFNIKIINKQINELETQCDRLNASTELIIYQTSFWISLVSNKVHKKMIHILIESIIYYVTSQWLVLD